MRINEGGKGRKNKRFSSYYYLFIVVGGRYLNKRTTFGRQFSTALMWESGTWYWIQVICPV